MDINLAQENLKWAPAKTVSAADKLIELKKNKDVWEVIRAIVQMWQETNPKEYDSFIYTLEHTKQTRKVTKGFRGVSYDKETGGNLRYKLDIPVKVIYMIRRLYPDMNLDKDFYNKWEKVFPKMVIMEKV
jgi:hypothetical protein